VANAITSCKLSINCHTSIFAGNRTDELIFSSIYYWNAKWFAKFRHSAFENKPRSGINFQIFLFIDLF